MAAPLATPLQAAQANGLTSLGDLVNTSARLWKTARIVEERWDQLFPFQLLILQHKGNGVYSTVSRYTLPIPPSSLQQRLPFAISTTITPGGVVEEHNADPLRLITLRGTTGVLPARSGGPAPAAMTFASSLFAGTIQAANNLQASAEALKSTWSFNQAAINDSELLGDLKGTTGYVQFLLLQRFLEEYVRAKKNGGRGKELRLAFAQWKTGEVFLVTPQTFDVERSVGVTRFDYTIQFLAWGRVTLQDGAKAVSEIVPLGQDNAKVQMALKNVSQARDILTRTRDLIRAAGQDVLTAVFEPVRQALFFLKDVAQVPLAISDLSDDLIRELQTTIVAAYATKAAFTGTGAALSSIPGRLEQRFPVIGKQMQNLGTRKGLAEAGRSGQALSANTPDPTSDIFLHPERYKDFLDELKVQALNITPRQKQAIEAERQRIRSLTRADFERQRDAVQLLADQFELQVGAGHQTVARLRGLQEVVPPNRQPTRGEFEAMWALSNLALELGRLAASRAPIGTNERLTRLQYLTGLARRSSISASVPQGQFLIPFPYGQTLERLSLRYLGSADRWMEIAALNNLRAPYIDEVGFTAPLLSLGSGNEIVVASSENLGVGQAVWLSSPYTSRTKRTIISIREPAPGQVHLRLDGASDLARFDQRAFLKAYLPGTVNSLQMIAIPTDTPSDIDELQLKPIPGIDPLDAYVRLGGIDLAITSTGDAAITEDGDWRLSIGLANLTQKLRVFTGTRQGTQVFHPEFGLALEVGETHADTSPQDVLNSLQALTEFEPAFESIEAASVRTLGPTTKIQASIRLREVGTILPVTVDILSR